MRSLPCSLFCSCQFVGMCIFHFSCLSYWFMTDPTHRHTAPKFFTSVCTHGYTSGLCGFFFSHLGTLRGQHIVHQMAPDFLSWYPLLIFMPSCCPKERLKCFQIFYSWWLNPISVWMHMLRRINQAGSLFLMVLKDRN